MKKLLLIAILTLVGCSTDETVTDRPTDDCNCGMVRQITYLPNGSVILKIKMNCNNELVEIETFGTDLTINDQYCF